MPEHKLRSLPDIQKDRKEKAMAEFLATVPDKEGWYSTREIFVLYRDYKIWCETRYPGVPRYFRDELTAKLYERQGKTPMSKL